MKKKPKTPKNIMMINAFFRKINLPLAEYAEYRNLIKKIKITFCFGESIVIIGRLRKLFL
jgi:hypothetical protein